MTRPLVIELDHLLDFARSTKEVAERIAAEREAQGEERSPVLSGRASVMEELEWWAFAVAREEAPRRRWWQR